MMDTLLASMQTPAVKEAILTMNIEDFRTKTDFGRNYGSWVRFERAFWTIKNFPEDKHYKPLSYPEKTKLSNFFKGIHLEYSSPSKKTATKGVFVADYGRLNEVWEEKVGMQKEIDLADTKKYPFISLYAEPIEDIVIDYLTDGLGAFEIIQRQNGVLLMAHSRNHIGENYLAIIKDWDLKLEVDKTKRKQQPA